MRKILALILALSVLFALGGCGEDPEQSKNTAQKAPVYFKEYPDLRTPESISGVSFVKLESNYYCYSLGSDRDKADAYWQMYTADALMDGYCIIGF